MHLDGFARFVGSEKATVKVNALVVLPNLASLNTLQLLLNPMNNFAELH
jgi:hypothetical protein